MAKRGGGSSGESSNTGLIVALVFFVLATIGLGVGMYMGYSAKSDAVKDASAAAAKEKTASDKAEVEEARRLAIKIAAGVEDPADKARFAAIKTKGQAAVDGDVAQFYTQAQTKLKLDAKDITRWSPAATDQPPKTLIGLAVDQQATAGTSGSKEKAAIEELGKERESYKTAVEDLQAKLKTAQDNLAKANKAVVDEQNTRAGGSAKKDEDINSLSEQVKDLSLKIKNLEVEKDREINKLRAQVDTTQKVRLQLSEKYGPLLEKLDQVRQARPELRDLAEVHDLLTRALEGTQSLVNDTPKGEIIKSANGQVFINLGTADNVRPGLSFSVLPAGSTGRGAAAATRKAAIEVVAVLEPHLSAAKVVEAANLVRDPLLKGDLLFNPAWSSSQREHVALAGIIDLNGDGIDDTADLIRALEKQGVVVDAWLDLKDRTIKGPGMTERTTYLIKGEKPIIPSSAAASLESNPLALAASDLIGKMTDMEQKAHTLGVQPVPYRRFLSLIGYKLPKVVQPADFSSSSYLRGASGAKAPADKEEKPK
jgi:hypothetical protein